ncbi:hypothetical protein PSYAC_04683 [Pseudomonas syringae pv. actinidiae str. M302091]|nr:hypothetical protein PSYAC_04683 [Pseudomonas syringae pv. actinidiae str. M302091]
MSLKPSPHDALGKYGSIHINQAFGSQMPSMKVVILFDHLGFHVGQIECFYSFYATGIRIMCQKLMLCHGHKNVKAFLTSIKIELVDICINNQHQKTWI